MPILPSFFTVKVAMVPLPLPFLVERQTRATARAVGLLDRGVLAPGYRADVNLIDADPLVARRPEVRYDLPAGGRRFVQRADGYVATIVAGQVTYENGEATGPLPGRLVRGPQAAPKRSWSGWGNAPGFSPVLSCRAAQTKSSCRRTFGAKAISSLFFGTQLHCTFVIAAKMRTWETC